MKISLIVLVYNHEKYICNCLDSIKYQIENYNLDRAHTVQVIVTDDASKDNSFRAVSKWAEKNRNVIPDFMIIKNDENLGTCKNYLNALKMCTGDYIKAIGGDDMFPATSLFEIFKYLNHYDIVQGLPFIYYENAENNVNDNVRYLNKSHKIGVREEKIDFYTMIHRYCFLNAPATYVSKKLLTDERVRQYLEEYTFTDDYPQWLKMSEIKDVRYAYIPVISVIYRRTEGSSYLIHNDELKEERLRSYRYALEKCKEPLGKAILHQTIAAIGKGRYSPKPYFSILSYLHESYSLKERNRTGYNEDVVIYIMKYIEAIIKI